MKTNRFTLGILAPVDAGKTTLAEALLYQGGNIRTLGRVDHRDALFDYYRQERERGITIFSKCAQLTLGSKEVSLLDTPGHADFSAEMERALSVMDYAVLVISGTEGVQSHTHTLFSLLRRYHVPAFLFVSKMDRPEADRAAVCRQLKEELQETCVDITGYRDRLENDEEFREEIALCDEKLTERYLNGEPIGAEDLRQLIGEEKLYPCLFGSARELQGIRELMEALEELSICPDYPEAFGGRIFKVARDEKGSCVTYLKVTGGSLNVRQEVTGTDGTRSKISQIRIYSGGRYDTVSEVPAGTVCGVTGPETALAGQGLGFETEEIRPELVPVFTYSVLPSAVSETSADDRRGTGSGGRMERRNPGNFAASHGRSTDRSAAAGDGRTVWYKSEAGRRRSGLSGDGGRTGDWNRALRAPAPLRGSAYPDRTGGKGQRSCVCQ